MGKYPQYIHILREKKEEVKDLKAIAQSFIPNNEILDV